MQTIHNVIKDTSPSQEHQYHHKNSSKNSKKCHRSLREFLMPLNSTDFNKIINIAPSGPIKNIQNILKDTRPSQEHQIHHQIQQKTLEMLSFFGGVLDGFKLNRFQPNSKHSTLRAREDSSKCHQGHQPRSGTSKSSSTLPITLELSLIFEGVHHHKLHQQPNVLPNI